MTLLTVPINVSNPNEAITDIKAAAKAGAQAIELRLDYLPAESYSQTPSLVQAVLKEELIAIATCRANWEGGHFSGNEQERVKLLKMAADAGCQYIDIECKALENDSTIFQPLFKLAKIIVSYHDFHNKPNSLAEICQRIKRHEPDIVKIAYMPTSMNDCFEAFELMRELGPKGIILAMGQVGLPSRILAKKFESFLTFASLESGKESAPGQITIQEIKKIYRWDAINPQTKVYGVIGDPVGHSMSPHIHNGCFGDIKFNGVYLLFQVAGNWDTFSAFFDGINERPWLDFCGFSITIPHKEHALQYVEESSGTLETLAKRIGAVNTLILNNEKISGFNTDYGGALDAVIKTLNISHDELKGLSVAIIGAGGVARALIAGFVDCQCRVTIYNRTVEKAQILADEFNCQAKSLEQANELSADILVNCTSVGMSPNIDAMPVVSNCIKSNMVVFDTIYNPLETKLLKDAIGKQCQCVDGAEMFVYQAARQFKLNTEKDANLALMRDIVIEKLQS